MAWIESHQELGRHPKTRRLARLLGVSLPTAVGHLHFLWWWALDYAQDGNLARYTAEDIADAVMWEGDPNQLVSALLQSGFLDQAEDGWRIHDWEDYAGRLIERREKDRQRKRAERRWAASRVPAEVQAASDGCPVDVQRTSDATIPNQTVPNQTVPNPTELPPMKDTAFRSEDNPPTIDNTRVCSGTEQAAPDGACSRKKEQGGENAGKAPKDEAYSPEFERFWEAYPRRVEKRRAWKAWKTRLREGYTPDALIAAAENYGEWCARMGTEERFIKHPATFLGPDRPFLEWERPRDSPSGNGKVPKAWAVLREYARRHAEEVSVP